MRLLTVVAASLLLAAAVPALGHPSNRGGDPDHKECTLHENIDEYKGNLTVERGLYARAGWWQGDSVALTNNTPPQRADKANTTSDAPDWMCGGDGGAAREGNDAPVWLRLAGAPNEQDSTDDKQPFRITVETSGGVVGAIDVFEYRDRGRWHHQATPRCPQGLVSDLLPNSGEALGGYLFRVAHETVDMHQRGRHPLDFSLPSQGDPLGSTMTVTVDPDRSVTGEYVVAIYPQAATSMQPAGPLNGPDEIRWTIDTTGDGTFDVDDGDEPPEMPYAASSWLSPLDHTFNCTEKLLGLVDTAQGRELPAIPGTADALDLFTSHLDDA